MTRTKVRIKMCGMTREEDIAYAAELGIDAIGLIFYEQSQRGISVSQAKKILGTVPLFMDIVAVVVNPSSLLVEEIINELPISWLQFHGEESAEFCNQFKKPYIKAIPALSAEIIYKNSAKYPQASAILLDTPSKTARGGTGLRFDWQLIPQDLEKPFVLAGGLGETNIVEAVRTCSPCAVDLSSAIETSPGIKDHEKMSRFVKALWGKQ